jgi:hypothetical protein
MKNKSRPFPQIKLPQLPFLTREMLKFGNISKLELKVRVKTHQSSSGGFIVRGLTRSGFFSIRIKPLTGNGNTNTFTLRLDDIPIWLSAIDTNDIYPHGAVFCSISLVINSDIAFELCSGFVAKATGISYPSAALNQTSPTQGYFKNETVSNPNAGDDMTVYNNQEERSFIRAITFQFTTDANVANRRVHIYSLSAGTGNARPNFFSNVDQPASTTRYYTCAPVPALLTDNDDDDIIIPIPKDLVLTGGTGFGTKTTNIQAGDQFSNIKYLHEVFQAGVG